METQYRKLTPLQENILGFMLDKCPTSAELEEKLGVTPQDLQALADEKLVLFVNLEAVGMWPSIANWGLTNKGRNAWHHSMFGSCGGPVKSAGDTDRG